MHNPCIRCGKERIDGKVWTEMSGQTLITHIKTVCPDSACQKIVDEEFAVAREKKELAINARRIRAEQSRNKLSTKGR